MPLIIHAASQCDICFSAYAWDEPDQAPHVIPCGHTFCKEYEFFLAPTFYSPLLQMLDKYHQCR